MNLRTNLRTLLTRSILFLLIATSSHAALITTPTGLSVGDQYRLVFVTSGSRDATSINIEDYNNFVSLAANAVPELASLGVTWSAIGSTSAVHARTNSGTLALVPGVAPIYRLDDTLVALDYFDLWDGSILASINRTELDTLYTDLVLTGTTSNGSSDASEPLGALNVEFGYASVTDSRWITQTGLVPPLSSAANAPFYALSSPITVSAVPEPSSFLLLGLGLCVYSGIRPSRRVKATDSQTP